MTSQFDAEYGRTSGAVINAVMKAGTNHFRGSAFAFLEDSALTARDYFAKKNDLTKPDTQGAAVRRHVRRTNRARQAALLRQRRARLNDNGVTINIPARPGIQPDHGDQGPRVEHGHPRRPPDQREQHLGRPLAAGSTPQLNKARPEGATFVEEEDDVDQTTVGTLSSVLGNTKLNTMRVTYTRENVKFANPATPPTAVTRSCSGRPSRSSRSWTGRSECGLGRLIRRGVRGHVHVVHPGLAWRPQRQARGPVRVRGRLHQRQETERHVHVRDQRPTTPTIPQLSRAPADPRARPAANTQREKLLRRVRPGQVEAPAGPQSQPGRAGTIRDIPPIDEVDNVASPALDYPVDTNDVPPRLGFTWDVSGKGRSVVRGGAGRFYDKTYFELIWGSSPPG